MKCWVCRDSGWVDLLLGRSLFQRVLVPCPSCCRWPAQTLREAVEEAGYPWGGDR